MHRQGSRLRTVLLDSIMERTTILLTSSSGPVIFLLLRSSITVPRDCSVLQCAVSMAVTACSSLKKFVLRCQHGCHRCLPLTIPALRCQHGCHRCLPLTIPALRCQHGCHWLPISCFYNVALSQAYTAPIYSIPVCSAGARSDRSLTHCDAVTRRHSPPRHHSFTGRYNWTQSWAAALGIHRLSPGNRSHGFRGAHRTSASRQARSTLNREST